VPLISIITAAYAPSADYLMDTARSIEALDMPADWELEWIVQEDGETPRLAEQLKQFGFCDYSALRRQLGIASTRNLALSRVRGVLLQALDQDDILLPSALTTLIPHFDEHAIHWAIGQADDLMPDGSRNAYPSPIPFGLRTAGAINDWAARNGGNWPIHGAALMMRTASFRALGGWTGIPSDDELATFAALSQMTDGYYEEKLTWLYRHHSKQTHRTELAQSLSEVGRRIALQRAAAVEEVGLTLSVASAAGFASRGIDVEVGSNIKDTGLL